MPLLTLPCMIDIMMHEIGPTPRCCAKNVRESLLSQTCPVFSDVHVFCVKKEREREREGEREREAPRYLQNNKRPSNPTQVSADALVFCQFMLPCQILLHSGPA